MAQQAMSFLLLLVSITTMIHALPATNQNEEPLPELNKIKNITVVQESEVKSNIIGNSTSIKRNGLIRRGALTVVLYSDNNYSGEEKWFSPVEDGCYNLNQYGFVNVVSSVNTGGGCINLYEGSNCNSRYIQLHPRSWCRHHDLNVRNCNFNDRGNSFRRC
jgi:hypothetical protein